jgi:DNA-binding transcriptional regulator YiaG
MDKKTWAEEVAEIIKTTGLPMRQVAEKLDIPYRTIQDWKYGKRTPDNFTKRAFRIFAGELKK